MTPGDRESLEQRLREGLAKLTAAELLALYVEVGRRPRPPSWNGTAPFYHPILPNLEVR